MPHRILSVSCPDDTVVSGVVFIPGGGNFFPMGMSRRVAGIVHLPPEDADAATKSRSSASIPTASNRWTRSMPERRHARDLHRRLHEFRK